MKNWLEKDEQILLGNPACLPRGLVELFLNGHSKWVSTMIFLLGRKMNMAIKCVDCEYQKTHKSLVIPPFLLLLNLTIMQLVPKNRDSHVLWWSNTTKTFSFFQTGLPQNN